MAKRSDTDKTNGGAKTPKKTGNKKAASSTSSSSTTTEPSAAAKPKKKAAKTEQAIIDRHLWEIQPVRDVLIILAIVGLIYLGYALSLVTVPILLAILLAYLFEPVVRGLLARYSRLKRPQAVGIILATRTTFALVF